MEAFFKKGKICCNKLIICHERKLTTAIFERFIIFLLHPFDNIYIHAVVPCTVYSR